MKYLKLYSCKEGAPSALFSIIYFKLQKAKSFYRIPRGKTFTSVKIHEGSFSTEFLYLSICLQFQNQNEHKNLFLLSLLLVSKTRQ